MPRHASTPLLRKPLSQVPRLLRPRTIGACLLPGTRQETRFSSPSMVDENRSRRSIRCGTIHHLITHHPITCPHSPIHPFTITDHRSPITYPHSPIDPFTHSPIAARRHRREFGNSGIHTCGEPERPFGNSRKGGSNRPGRRVKSGRATVSAFE